MKCRAAMAIAVCWCATAHAQKQFGFDNSKPSGQPYLSVQDSLKRMKPYPGFTISAFAAEPMVVNPVAFTVDERGRLWVVECFEYPNRTPQGKMPRDRIVILEDTNGDGVADKRTVFAEGKDFPTRFDLATGIEVGHGGVFLGASPYLWFIENKNDKPGKFEVLLKGFGSEDTHETLNTFQWGSDGWLYGLHGIFTNSNVVRGDAPPDAPGIKLNAGMWRYQPKSRKFEVFAEGTSNPWGWDYRNTDGERILCCCVIPHLFHIFQGGIYRRQAGQSMNPYAYGYINEICDHTFHKESGWAHAGLLSLDTSIMPPELRDSVIFGSIHGNSIKRNTLSRNGSTFLASKAPDFLTSGDKNFRPINMRWGPSGEIYIIDWHDQNPCHQAEAGSWDYARGRVYRIQRQNARRAVPPRFDRDDLPRLSTDANPFIARTALRIQYEIDQIHRPKKSAVNLMRAIDRLAFLGDFGEIPIDRRAGAIHEMMNQRGDAADQAIPLMIWYAYEPIIAANPVAELEWLKKNITGNPLIQEHIVSRAVRRLVATNRADDMDAVVAFIRSLAGRFQILALEGMAKSLEGRQLQPPAGWNKLYADLQVTGNEPSRKLLRAIAVSFRDPIVVAAALTAGRNVDLPRAERIGAVHELAQMQAPEAIPLFLSLVAPANDAELRLESLRGLAAFDNSTTPSTVLSHWPSFTPALRGEAVNLLAGRRSWAKSLLQAVAANQVPPTDLNTNVILRMKAFGDSDIDSAILRVWGAVRTASADKTSLIEQKRSELAAGTGSVVRGKKVFTEHCGKCHKFEGAGHDVGPALDGAGRDIEYLLANILDPNRVIGAPYQLRRLMLADGRIAEGMLAGEDANSITLKTENNQVNVFEKKIIEQVQVSENSVMPEGLAKPLSDQDFRDLVRYLMVHPYVTHWETSGPVRAESPPAAESEWKTIDAPVTGRIALPSVVGDHVMTLRTSISAAQTMNTTLLLGSTARLKVWLDGAVVFEGKPGSRPDSSSLTIKLAAGRHQLRVEARYLGEKNSLYVRLNDPDRKLAFEP